MLKQEKAIRKVLSDDRRTSHFVPMWQDIEVPESIQAALGPLADFTDMLSVDNYVTVSALNPVLYILTNQVLVRKEEDTNLTKDIKTRIQDYLGKKYSSDSELSELLNIASFLDPRFMAEYIQNTYRHKLKWLSQRQTEVAITKIGLPERVQRWEHDCYCCGITSVLQALPPKSTLLLQLSEVTTSESR